MGMAEIVNFKTAQMDLFPPDKGIKGISMINIGIIPHHEQRYETVGDYWYPQSFRQEVRISDMQNEDYEFLVLIHELIEAHLCRKRGIKEEDIKAFDEAYEAKRQEGDFTEPGDSAEAPYRTEHWFATFIEAQIAEELGVDWEEYSNVVNSL